MPCGNANIPEPKLISSFPDASKCNTGGLSDLRQSPPQRSKAQMLLPSIPGATAMTPPHGWLAGNSPNLMPGAYGLGSSIDGIPAGVSAPTGVKPIAINAAMA